MSERRCGTCGWADLERNPSDVSTLCTWAVKNPTPDWAMVMPLNTIRRLDHGTTCPTWQSKTEDGDG